MTRLSKDVKFNIYVAFGIIAVLVLCSLLNAAGHTSNLLDSIHSRSNKAMNQIKGKIKQIETKQKEATRWIHEDYNLLKEHKQQNQLLQQQKEANDYNKNADNQNNNDIINQRIENHEQKQEQTQEEKEDEEEQRQANLISPNTDVLNRGHIAVLLMSLTDPNAFIQNTQDLLPQNVDLYVVGESDEQFSNISPTNEVINLNNLVENKKTTIASALSLVFSNSHKLYDHAIVFEDEVEHAKDIFDYFVAMESVARDDPSIMCVSAYNPAGISSTAYNPLNSYRSQAFGQGVWMIPRVTWDEFPDDQPSLKWKEWIREYERNNDKSCIYPEVSRAVPNTDPNAILNTIPVLFSKANEQMPIMESTKYNEELEESIRKASFKPGIESLQHTREGSSKIRFTDLNHLEWMLSRVNLEGLSWHLLYRDIVILNYLNHRVYFVKQ